MWLRGSALRGALCADAFRFYEAPFWSPIITVMEASITVMMGPPRASSGKGPGRPVLTVIEASITVMMGLPGARPKRPGKAIGDREQGQQGGVFQTRLGQRGSAD